jgi:alpha-tubulin suppressor-like RCC1 family protein
MCCTSSGDVYVWGSNKFHVLGTSPNEDDKAERPVKVPNLKDVVEVSAGDCSSAALTKDGKLFTWGFPGSFTWSSGALGRPETEDSKTPGRVHVGGGEDIRLKQIASGAQHMMGLGLDGELWIWGKGANGVMGDGKNLDRALPVPIVFLLDTDVKVKQIACGSNFNLVVDTNGHAYGWGGNERGQLGLGGGFSMDLESVPRQIELLANEKIVHISAGMSHAAAVTENGEVYMWGYSVWTEPHKMTALHGKRVIKTSCGNNFTCALTDTGELYAWGKSMFVARTGALGLGDNSRHAQPELVKALTEPISQVSCGQRYVLAINGLPEI